MLQNPQWRWFSCPVVVTLLFLRALDLVAGQVRLPLCFHDSKKKTPAAPYPLLQTVGMGSDSMCFISWRLFHNISPVQRDKRSEAKKKGIFRFPFWYPLGIELS